MGELGALFNPGMRHELEERQAKAARREEEGNARDGDLRIDLESGVAVINVPGNDEDDDQSKSTAAAGHDQDFADQDAADHDGADHDGASQDAADEAVADQDAADQAGPAPEPAPPVLRPRGKRGMTTANR
jgi:hypothetical protein